LTNSCYIRENDDLLKREARISSFVTFIPYFHEHDNPLRK